MANKYIEETYSTKIVDLGGHTHELTGKAGANAFGQVSNGVDVRVKTVTSETEIKETVIPYHAICHAEATITKTEREFEDSTCVEE